MPKSTRGTGVFMAKLGEEVSGEELEERRKRWAELEKAIEACKKCPLHKTRTRPVVGEGPLNAKIMFIGEAPGREEDLTGRPFVGRAGKVLTEVLESLGIKREDVFIGNIVKCRPPNNRDPTDKEKALCSPWLDMQISIIKPKILVALGRHSGAYLVEKYRLAKDVREVRGKLLSVSTLFGKTYILITYHPAALLYNPRLRAPFEAHLKQILHVVKAEEED